MSISRLTGQDARGTSTSASVTATFASTPTSGNLLRATVLSNTAAGTNALSGWTPASDQQVGNAVFSVTEFYKVAGAGEATGITATATGATQMRIHIYEYNSTSGWPASPVDQTNFGNSAGSNVTSRSTNSVTTTVADCLLAASCGTNGNITAPAWDSSFTLRQADAANIALFDADQIVTATGTYSTTATWTTGRKATAIIVAYKAASGGTSATVSASVVAASTTVGSPTVQTGQTTTPAVVTASSAVGAPAIQTGQTATPGVVAGTITVGSPTVKTDQTATPSVVAATTAVSGPTIRTGATVTPSVVATTATVPTPTVQTGSTATATPAAVAGVATIGTPGLSTGTTVSPAVVLGTTTVSAPDLSTAQLTAPSTVSAVATVGAVTIQTGSSVTPAVVAGVVAVGAPTVTTAAILRNIVWNIGPASQRWSTGPATQRWDTEQAEHRWSTGPARVD